MGVIEAAKERKYTRTRHTVLKDEDPTYLQVITYASKLDEQCEAFVRSAELYIDQLEKRVNATKLRDLGEAALKMGQSEEGWGKALQKRSKNYSLGYTLHALSDCAESMTFTGTASELRACEALRTLVPSFEDCRQRVTKQFEKRSKIGRRRFCTTKSPATFTTRSSRRTDAPWQIYIRNAWKLTLRERLGARRMILSSKERGRIFSAGTRALELIWTRSLRAFAKTRAILCRQDAECWEMMLRDPIGDGDVKMDDRVGVDDRAEREIEAACERVVANNNLEESC